MSATFRYRHMIDNKLVNVRGWKIADEMSLQAVVAAEAGVEILSGTVASVNAAGNLVQGMGTAPTLDNTTMPYLVMNGTEKLENGLVHAFNLAAHGTGKGLLVVPVSAVAEWDTTGYDPTATVADFKRGAKLYVVLTGTHIGKLTTVAGTAGSPCVGMVTEGIVDNGKDQSVLRFMTGVWVPGTNA